MCRQLINDNQSNGEILLGFEWFKWLLKDSLGFLLDYLENILLL